MELIREPCRRALHRSQWHAPNICRRQRYRPLIPVFRQRVAATVDFERVEPREFWRLAVGEALRETASIRIRSSMRCSILMRIDAARRIEDTVTARISLLARWCGVSMMVNVLATAARDAGGQPRLFAGRSYRQRIVALSTSARRFAPAAQESMRTRQESATVAEAPRGSPSRESRDRPWDKPSEFARLRR